MTRRDKARLALVLRRLDALTDPEDESCAVSVEAKRAVELYVTSWIRPLVVHVVEGRPARRGDILQDEIDARRPKLAPRHPVA